VDIVGQERVSPTLVGGGSVLTGRYLYGRGVSDNKGPILAVACAAAALRQRRELDVDLVMILEGEEEAGSGGFASTVRKNKVGRSMGFVMGRLNRRTKSVTSMRSFSPTRHGSMKRTHALYSV